MGVIGCILPQTAQSTTYLLIRGLVTDGTR